MFKHKPLIYHEKSDCIIIVFPPTQFLALNRHPKTSLPLSDFCQKYELENQNVKQFKTRIINQIIKQIKNLLKVLTYKVSRQVDNL